MAIIALHSSATGLSALNTALDVISNNLANINTPGFKQSRANFQDLLYMERAQPGVENSNGDQAPIGLFVGLGTRVTGTQQSFAQGPPIDTGRPTDVSIEGLGFFRVRVEDNVGGGFAYTRAGSFTLNSDGELVLASHTGRRLDPPIAIPADAVPPIGIGPNGEVFVNQPGATEPTLVGTIQISAFINPEGLEPIGENLFIESAASGPPITGEPQTEQLGKLVQGTLEGSNVDPTRELIELIKTQRAFEMNSNTIRAADETLRNVANLRR
jgi:flagellar basal-body rod protein FlgG